MLKKRFHLDGKTFRLFDSVPQDAPPLSLSEPFPIDPNYRSASILSTKSKSKSTRSPSNDPEILTCMDVDGNFYVGDMVR